MNGVISTHPPRGPAERAKLLHQVLADRVELYANRLDAHAARLELVVDLTRKKVRDEEASTLYLRCYAEHSSNELRGHIRAACAWLEATPKNGLLDQELLQGAVSALQRSTSRASVLLGRVDIMLATTGQAAS